MSKRYSNENSINSPAKRFKAASSKDKNSHQNVAPINQQSNVNDIWGDDFGVEEIEEMDFIASQATQEVSFFISLDIH